MIYRLLLFLVLNFVGLAIGGLFTGKGVPSDWYINLNKAPWTPPGWVFGAAWTTIMICFSVYLSYLWDQVTNQRMLIGLITVLWVLNVLWNPVFFYSHNVVLGLVVISALTLLVAYAMIFYWNRVGAYSFLLMPYVVWLCIATSLNAYIVWNN